MTAREPSAVKRIITVLITSHLFECISAGITNELRFSPKFNARFFVGQTAVLRHRHLTQRREVTGVRRDEQSVYVTVGREV